MKIKRFEDLDVWKKARGFTKLVYELTGKGEFSKDWGLRDQMRRAAVSIMSNIAEGFDGGSKLEFSRFLSMARRSASEVQSQLYTALDQVYIEQTEFSHIYEEAEQIKKMITGFIKYLKGHRQTSGPVHWFTIYGRSKNEISSNWRCGFYRVSYCRTPS